MNRKKKVLIIVQVIHYVFGIYFAGLALTFYMVWNLFHLPAANMMWYAALALEILMLIGIYRNIKVVRISYGVLKLLVGIAVLLSALRFQVEEPGNLILGLVNSITSFIIFYLLISIPALNPLRRTQGT